MNIMEAFSPEQIEEVNNIAVIVALYTRATYTYPLNRDDPKALHKAEMLLMHIDDLRESQNKQGYEYADEDRLSFWEKHARNDIYDLTIDCGERK